MSSDPRRRRRPAVLAGGLVLLLVLVAGVVGLFAFSSEEGDVSNPEVEFAEGDEEIAVVEEPAAEDAGASDAGRPFSWPHYGLTKSRTSHLPLDKPLRPPFKRSWKLGGSILLEFTPVLGERSLFLLKNNAALYALTRKTGKVRWKRKLGYLAASAPAYAYGTVFVTILERSKGVEKGRVMAIRPGDGSVRWSRKLPSRSESSPLVHRGWLYFGSEDGTVYGLRARDGYVRWKHKAKGAVKGALALADGKLYFGDYAGNVSALDAETGKLVWRTGTSGESLGRSGNFYSTPAVAFGRVYIGNTDGGVYSFSTRTGKLAWRKETDGYVYSTPAVADVPDHGPTVFIGSYDRHLYALDARTGRVRWSKDAGGRISGGVVVLGDLVFYSTLEGETVAVTTTSGRRIWRFGRGAFNPVVSTGRSIFVTGETSLYAFDARPTKAEEEEVKRRRALEKRVAKRHRAIRERNRLRRSGATFCYRSNGERVCRRPAPLVCFKRSEDNRTICRPRHGD